MQLKGYQEQVGRRNGTFGQGVEVTLTRAKKTIN